MGANSSRVQNTPDFDAQVVLRNAADAAETSTTIEAAVRLADLRTALWHNYEVPYGKVVVDIEVTELDVAGTNEYALELLVDTAASMNNAPAQIQSIPIPAVGLYQIVVDSSKLPVFHTNHGAGKWIAIRAAMDGDSTPAIRYGARISKSLGA